MEKEKKKEKWCKWKLIYEILLTQGMLVMGIKMHSMYKASFNNDRLSNS